MAVVTGTAQLSVGFNQTVTSGLINTQTLPASISATSQYTNGTGASMVDLVYAKQLTLLASTPQTLDLTSLTDLSGATVNFARIRELVIQVVTTTSGYTVTVGAAAANPWAALWGTTGTMVIPAGSIFRVSEPNLLSTAGLVTSGTSKNLKLDPGANQVVINLMIVGGSAAS